jgi:hypothetical protein
MSVVLLLPAIVQTAAFTLSAEISFDGSRIMVQNCGSVPFPGSEGITRFEFHLIARSSDILDRVRAASTTIAMIV